MMRISGDLWTRNAAGDANVQIGQRVEFGNCAVDAANGVPVLDGPDGHVMWNMPSKHFFIGCPPDGHPAELSIDLFQLRDSLI